MSESKPEELNSQALPFFARFLEGQSFEDLSDKESEGIGGGSCGVTKKENDELVQTLKFPSDQEDLTKKYPSDSDEQIFTTQKYPSDGDDHGPAE
ncbi:microviridin/marinostatin family tricyclic proteinase inhibitor [Nostoc sp. XA010]|uniref:microviridin/marinostatin family tricyclic proteinase inhibitor n=1 Tax=Nostoc sp. XA010 TaxID=2780407 RepID=UPI001E2F0799|nr:microviridin/marinostatin family tricyclic proteinase inhibitor [Nostoc sp. XA010]MCC5660665.1 microviridin/marinostatin family tricyclic proteinase inhibitor [Nostoc sp. XA010]